jgi:hypothetical protein
MCTFDDSAVFTSLLLTCSSTSAKHTFMETKGRKQRIKLYKYAVNRILLGILNM